MLWQDDAWCCVFGVARLGFFDFFSMGRRLIISGNRKDWLDLAVVCELRIYSVVGFRLLHDMASKI